MNFRSSNYTGSGSVLQFTMDCWQAAYGILLIGGGIHLHKAVPVTCLSYPDRQLASCGRAFSGMI